MRRHSKSVNVWDKTLSTQRRRVASALYTGTITEILGLLTTGFSSVRLRWGRSHQAQAWTRKTYPSLSYIHRVKSSLPIFDNLYNWYLLLGLSGTVISTIPRKIIGSIICFLNLVLFVILEIPWRSFKDVSIYNVLMTFTTLSRILISAQLSIDLRHSFPDLVRIFARSLLRDWLSDSSI